MGWETRRNGTYYYRKTWRNGRAVSEYVGAGLLGQLRASFDDEDRAQRARQLAEHRRERAQDAQAARQLAELSAFVRQAVGEVLQACGYHQHRGTWRRRRMTTKDLVPAQKEMAEVSKDARVIIEKADALRVAALYKVIDAGKAKPEELAEFRKILEANPGTWRVFGGLSQQAEFLLMGSYQKSASTKAALQIGLDEMRREMGIDTAPALERMVIEQVCLSWLRLGLVEGQEAGAIKRGDASQIEHWNRTLSAAQRRHLRAVETLARVRRLLRPLLQVNVASAGGQQVNVASAGGQQVNVAGNVSGK